VLGRENPLAVMKATNSSRNGAHAAPLLRLGGLLFDCFVSTTDERIDALAGLIEIAAGGTSDEGAVSFSIRCRMRRWPIAWSTKP
jgi:hypothetical protein